MGTQNNNEAEAQLIQVDGQGPQQAQAAPDNIYHRIAVLFRSSFGQNQTFMMSKGFTDVYQNWGQHDFNNLLERTESPPDRSDITFRPFLSEFRALRMLVIGADPQGPATVDRQNAQNAITELAVGTPYEGNGRAYYSFLRGQLARLEPRFREIEAEQQRTAEALVGAGNASFRPQSYIEPANEAGRSLIEANATLDSSNEFKGDVLVLARQAIDRSASLIAA